MRYYTGIGSRKTPSHICEKFTRIAEYLQDWTLRSGGADGADLAFEHGSGHRDIFLPWRGFNGNHSELYTQLPEARRLAEKHHPHWENLTEPVRKLMCRNAHQVLGRNLDDPSTLLICWTENGEEIGGTALAIRLAKEYNVPIFNFGAKDLTQELWKFLKEL
jgi:hypothetical protein